MELDDFNRAYPSDRLYSCPVCGGVVKNRSLHLEWHESIQYIIDSLQEVTFALDIDVDDLKHDVNALRNR